MGKHRNYPPELKLEAVQRYKNGDQMSMILKDLNILSARRVYIWTSQFDDGNIKFEDLRGLSKVKDNISTDQLTDKEYIKYLEAEVEMLKLQADVLQPWRSLRR